MIAISNKLVPMMKNSYHNAKNWRPDWNWSELSLVMSAYGIQLIILTCIAPLLTILPALAFNVAIGAASFIGFILAIIMLIPWTVVPVLFIQHITTHSRFGKIASYIYLGILLITFVLWIIVLPSI